MALCRCVCCSKVLVNKVSKFNPSFFYTYRPVNICKSYVWIK